MAHDLELTPEAAGNRVDLGKLAPAAGAVAIVGAIVTTFLLVTNSHEMFGSYLYGLMFWVSVTLGMFGLSVLHHTVRGSWSVAILRLLEAGGGARMLTVMGLLFLPLIYGVFSPDIASSHVLYEWADTALVQGDKILRGKAPLLNPVTYTVLTAIFFAIWIAFAAKMRQSTLRQEQNGDFKLEEGRSSWGAAGMVMYFLTVSFALFLWLMSLNPHWYSTMYGVWMIVASAGAALALCNVIVCINARKFPYNTIVAPSLTKDLGNMQFVTVMLWGYTSISQFLIIWNGNIPETTSYFKDRTSEMHPPGMEANHWGWVGLILIVGRFFVPFFSLLAPRTKKYPGLLQRVCGWIFVMHIIDMYLIVQPSLHGRAIQGPIAGHLLYDVLAWVTVGAIWLAIFASQTRKAALLPKYDNRLQEALHHAH
jgi:hypothetical protein